MQKVVVMGLGYIGLPTAAIIANNKIPVLGVDINPKVVNIVNKGEVHISEPDLDTLVKEVVKNGYLKVDIKPDYADAFIITVPTPFKEDYHPDLSYVKKAIDMVLPYLQEGNLLIIESTVPVGATEQLYKYILQHRPELKGKLYMAYCPERVLPGRIMEELINNSRIIGGIDEQSAEKAKEFYKLFVQGDIFLTDAKTAELCKLVENAYRDVNIAFANEISLLCDKLNIDVWELINLANKHPRVNILKPSVGVGGHCIAVDPWFLITLHPQETRLMRTAREVNMYKTEWVIKKIETEIEKYKEKYKKDPKIVCLGLTYKPNVDDLRESPALYIVRYLLNKKYNVLPVDPYVSEEKVEFTLYPLEEALKEADIVAILVAHRYFKKFKDLLQNKKVLDFCGVLKE